MATMTSLAAIAEGQAEEPEMWLDVEYVNDTSLPDGSTMYQVTGLLRVADAEVQGVWTFDEAEYYELGLDEGTSVQVRIGAA